MADYVISRLASYDLDDIADYSIEQFGFDQADRYAEGLIRCFEKLAANRFMGHLVSVKPKGLRAFEYQSHTIFYKPVETSILIVRVLHQAMDAKRHL